MTDVARSLDISISAEKLLFDAHSTLIFFLRLHCIAAKRSIDHVCPLRFWALRKNVLDSRSCTEIWLSTLLLFSLPPMYNPHGTTFLISVLLVMFTGRLCCGFGDLTKWSSLCVITTPSEVWPVLRTFGIALVNLAHFTHRVWIRGTTGTISTRECNNQSCTISVGNYYSRQACWTKVTPHPKSQTCSQVTKRLDGGVVVVQGA